MSQCRAFTANDMTGLVGKYRWVFREQRGSHAQYKHPVLGGRITIDNHSGKTLPVEIVKSMFAQAGMTHFFKMFQQGAPFKTVEKAIQAEACARFDAPQPAAAPPAFTPRLEAT
jgi:predicted RNA binding protein YcfA (HicA-like mRNA interferase family)